MKDNSIRIRKGTKADLPAILELVKGLAKFEKEPDAVSATLEDYHKAFDTGLIACDVAELDGQDGIIGMTLYYNTFSTWKGLMLYLEDFYVLPEFRSLGVGGMLWDVLIEEARARKCVLLKWQVLDWNKDAIRFYERKNAIIDQDWCNGRLWLR